MTSRIRLRLTRDGILFIGGMLGIGYETVASGGDRPSLLVLFAAMIGLPAFLRTDEKQAGKIVEAVVKEQGNKIEVETE